MRWLLWLVRALAALCDEHVAAINREREPGSDSSRDAAAAFDSDDSESAVVQELRKNGGTVRAHVRPTQD